MRLTGDQRKRLTEALLAAFPTEAALSQMASFGLDEHLAVIAGGINLKDRAFNLVAWAEARGRTEELIEAARDENPGNRTLRAVAEQLRLAPASNELEAVVLAAVPFTDVEEWRDHMARRE